MNDFQTSTENVEQNQIRVVRYLRPKIWEWSGYAFQTNLYGVTLVFDVDYETQMVQAYWSICNGDNFNKKQGVQYALNKGVKTVFPISQIQESGSLTYALVEVVLDVLGERSEDYFDFELFSDYLDLFLNASRKMK